MTKRRLGKSMQNVATTLIRGLDEDNKRIIEQLSDPSFLSVFSGALGLDWKTSGHTSVALSAVKTAFHDLKNGLKVVNKIPDLQKSKNSGISNEQLEILRNCFKTTQRVDTCEIQEGHGQLAAHFIIYDNENWTVINQKLYNQDARRYHWAMNTRDFVEAPHEGIMGRERSIVMDLTSNDAENARKTITDLAQEQVITLNNQLAILKAGQRSLSNLRAQFPPMQLPKLFFPNYLAKARETKPNDFEELLNLPGMGPGMIRGLAALSTIFYSAPPSFEDPRTHDWDVTEINSGCKEARKYNSLFLDILKDSSLSKKQKFEVNERLNQMVD